MKDGIIEYGDLSEDELFRLLEKFGANSLNSGKVTGEFITEVFETCLNDEDGRFERRVILPSFPDGVIGMMIPTTRYWVSIKTSALAGICATLDLFFTGGFASTGAGLTGALRQAIIRLDDKSGEICILQIATDDSIALPSRDEIIARTHTALTGHECRNPNFNCRHRRDSTCAIGTKHISDSLQNLMQKDILLQASDGALKVSW